MDPIVRQLFSAGLANSTKRSYSSGSNRVSVQHLVLPPTLHQLSYFVAFHFKEGLAPSSVKSYLSAVRHAQIALGMGHPHISVMPQLEKDLRRLSPGQSRTFMLANYSRYPPVRKMSMEQCCGRHVFFRFFLRCGEVVVPSDSTFDEASHLAAGDVRTSHPHYACGQHLHMCVL